MQTHKNEKITNTSIVYKSQKRMAPLTPEEMKHILDVAEEMDTKREELQQDEIIDDEFSGYKFTSKKLN